MKPSRHESNLLKKEFMNKRPAVIIEALLCMAAISGLGFALLGNIPAILFTLGFFAGFILWFIVPTDVTFSSIKVPYYLTFTLFIINKLEEYSFDFFPELAVFADVTVPKYASIEIYMLQALAWAFVPLLIKRGNQLGYYLLWTLFTSMGFIELIHFFLPLFFTNYLGYFPGLASAVILVPAAWWGMYRLL